MASLASRILISIWAFLFLVAVAFWSLFPSTDPYRCRSLLETGRWIDRPSENGTRGSFHHWQPDGCLIHQYSSKDVRKCMEGRSIVLVGDSLNRQIGYGIGRILAGNEARRDQENVTKHSDSHFSYYGVAISNIWNPWLHVDTSENVTLIRELAIFRDEMETPPTSIKDQKAPAMVLLGGGAWFSFGKTESEKQVQMNDYLTALTSLNHLVGWDMKGFFTAPMDGDGVGNRVFFAPPGLPAYLGDDEMTRNNKSEARAELVRFQKRLHMLNDEYNFPFAWSMPATSDYDNATIVDPEGSAFHVTDLVAEAKANIYLNLRCNGKLDRLNERSFTGTCCTDYGGKPTVQLAFVYVGWGFLIVCLTCEILHFANRCSMPQFKLFNMSIGGAFVLPLLMSYYADRTQMMAKGDKVWSFGNSILCLIWIIPGLATLRKSPTRASGDDITTVTVNSTLLSRDQTNEWKGWMQFVLLAYHWAGGDQSIQAGVFARLLASSYIFQSGYGHTSYFLLKKDFSFSRVASVLLRLNILTCSLCFFTNSDYTQYSFVALANFWFLAVWAILGLGHHRYNQNTHILLAKILISATTITFFFKYTPASQWTHEALKLCFNIQWDWETWEARLGNDLYITYAGMITAVIKHKYAWSPKFPLMWFLVALSVIILGAIGHSRSKEDASPSSSIPWYPIVSIGPVLAYLVLRNASSTLRCYHSYMLAWMGQCSLEFYILQFHLLQAANGRGILLTGAFGGDGSLVDRWRDLVFIMPLFIWISYRASSATREIVKIIMAQESREVSEDYIPLSNTLDKDCTDLFGSTADGGLSQLASGLLADCHSLWSQWSKRSSITQFPRGSSLKALILSTQARVFILVITVWVLNLFSPGPSNVILDDEYRS
ncbi:10 TM acyl transferase domain found in Cas1p-domain-containing protein [Mariannaea sp. PMI_226]|nr:10 TM acyl transferase domain found in Cas1p-domain-containing protein [Mariannaea sp. PMI_226]